MVTEEAVRAGLNALGIEEEEPGGAGLAGDEGVAGSALARALLAVGARGGGEIAGRTGGLALLGSLRVEETRLATQAAILCTRRAFEAS